MRDLAITFERVVNRGFGDEPARERTDRRTGEKYLHPGTKGEHVQRWRCAMIDQRGWPVVGHSVEYFQKKIAEGYKPVDITGVGAPSPSWNKDITDRVMAVIHYIAPMVEMQKRLDGYERAESGKQGASTRKPKAESAEALSAAG